jgi:hypothetical protein
MGSDVCEVKAMMGEMAERIAETKESALSIEMPIEVSGFDRSGRFFTQRAVIREVTRTGCRFQLAIEIDRDSLLAIRAMARGTGFTNSATPLLFHAASIEKEKDGWVLTAVAVERCGSTGLSGAHNAHFST